MTTVVQKVPPKKKKVNNKIWFWANDCKYEVILENVKNRKWKLIQDEKYEGKSNMYWVDVATIHERFRTIQPWQTINHFPGMPNIARKNRMGQNLNRMLKLFPREYSFYPRTWVLPGELNDFRAQFDNQGNSIGNKIYIIKPDTGCQGRGIFLTRTFDTVPQHENVVAQLYIKKPLLLDGFKFDLRIYCLVSSVKPLRMYLFQDGLVRMCTEEYTKPTKQNLSMVCMHLTNYAVNKLNSNFQQPSAKSSEEAQDEGSKRSLHWFMNFIREEHGEAKASWLWKRIGTLCVRTVLSIMPTLSREYDQHFKSFSGIPYKSTIPKVERRPRGDSKGGADSDDEAVAEEENEDDDDDDDDDDDQDDNEDGNEEEVEEKDEGAAVDGAKANGDTAASAAPGTTKKKKRRIQWRGSRCFEILGFDIMMDSNLKPWLIEVNHLPSFGTDSPLDLDIKERLMQQVISSVATKADDEQAYNAYHKAEATRRLHAKREMDKVAAAAASAAATAAKPKPKRPVLPPGANARGATGEGPSAPSDSGKSASQAEAEKVEPVDEAEEDDLDAEVTPERLQEIKDQLVVVYEEYSPEKIPKIDRLLAKYTGREEEFLRFVHLKYGLPPPLSKRQRAQEERERLRREADAAAAEAAAEAEAALAAFEAEAPSNGEAADASPSETTADEGGTGAADATSKGDDGKGSAAGRELQRKGRQVSRSLSPTPSTSRRPAWKGNVEDDAAYRAEVLAAHVPQESDEWMIRELKKLVQFTRIFPPEQTSSSKGDKDEEENDGKDEDGDDDGDKEDAVEGSDAAAASSSAAANAKPSVKSANYEEIMVQVFLQDKRQTMRLRCPLPSRAKSGSGSDTSSLPPLDSRSSSSSKSAAASAKGIGWRAPPPKVEKKEAPKVVTQSQLESAKRLSQGLSVAQIQSQSTRSKYVSSIAPVLVMDEYEMSGTPNQQLTSAGNIWMQSRLQSVKQQQQQQQLQQQQQGLIRGVGRGVNRYVTPASVLRQQIFHFGSEGAAGPGGEPVSVPTPPTSNPPSELGGYNFSIAGSSVVGRTSSLGLGGGGGGVSGGGSVVSAMGPTGGPPAGYGAQNGYGRPAQQGSANASVQRGADHAQEEMLRQLFPGWF